MFQLKSNGSCAHLFFIFLFRGEPVAICTSYIFAECFSFLLFLASNQISIHFIYKPYMQTIYCLWSIVSSLQINFIFDFFSFPLSISIVLEHIYHRLAVAAVAIPKKKKSTFTSFRHCQNELNSYWHWAICRVSSSCFPSSVQVISTNGTLFWVSHF